MTHVPGGLLNFNIFASYELHLNKRIHFITQTLYWLVEFLEKLQELLRVSSYTSQCGHGMEPISIAVEQN